MVAMVNHTAVAALHRESTHGDGGHASGVDLQRGGEGGDGLQENSSTNPGDQVDDQADGPFVWETTVSLTDLQTHIAKDHDMKHPSSLYVKTETYRQLFPMADPKIGKVC